MTETASPRSGHIAATVQGAAGVLTLNRPQALNALSLGMIRDITQVLKGWSADERVQVVVLRGQGREGKAPAFCAGGDIRFFHDAAKAGDPRLEDFFSEEYALNHLIHRYRKPVVALMDGICMGGGMGLAQGATVRVVTEHSKLAMPETNIGLFPDVGGGWFLARCPGRLGEYLALSGHVLGPDEACEAGLADVRIAAQSVDDLVGRLAAGEPPARVTQAMAQAAGQGALAPHREIIDRLFDQDTLPAIGRSLSADGSAFAGETLETLKARSPLMMAVALEQVRRARTMSLADDLRMERDMVRHCFHGRDGGSETVEGIRALVVDKDRQPQWAHDDWTAVTRHEVLDFFDSPWPGWAHPLRDLD